jgi:hypothetical protein
MAILTSARCAHRICPCFTRPSCLHVPKRRAQNVADQCGMCCQVGGQMGAEEGGSLVEVDFFDQF